MRIFAILGSVIAFALLTAVAWVAVLAGPPLTIAPTHSGAVVHVETLGEYVTTIHRVRIEEMLPSQQIVFEAVAVDGKAPQITNFSLSAGSNNTTFLEPFGRYRIVCPSGPHFVLQPDRRYRITIWGKGLLPSHTDLVLH